MAGENHGWPDVSLGRDYRTQDAWSNARAAPGVFPPVFEFLPTLAPSGLAVVQGGGWYETWQGNLPAGGLRAQRVLRRVVRDRTVVHAEELLLIKVGRIRDLRQGPDGHICVLSDEEDGGLYRIEPAKLNRPARAGARVTQRNTGNWPEPRLPCEGFRPEAAAG